MLWWGSAPGTPRPRSPLRSPAATRPLPHTTHPKNDLKAQICTLHLHGLGPHSFIGDAIWGWRYCPVAEPLVKSKAFPIGTWGGRGDKDPRPVPGGGVGMGTMGLPRVSPIISRAASPSTGRPQRLWQPHLFTG